MCIAIIHELWGAGAARCARDLERELGRRHEVVFYPKTHEDTSSRVRAALAGFRPDVVHCHSFYGSLPYGFLSPVTRAFATCLTVHDPRPIGAIEVPCWECDRNDWCLRCPLVAGRWRKVLKNPYFRARVAKRWHHYRCATDLRVVAPSRYMLDRLRRRELRRFRLQVIPYGIDTDSFRADPEARKRFGFQSDELVVLHSAFSGDAVCLDRRKGLLWRAEAFVGYVLPRVPNAWLAVAGEGVVPNHPRVRPLGRIAVSELGVLYAAADIFVCPTLGDNLPYTVLEAMACECPVVGSRVGGLPEEVQDGVTGVLVPPRDVKALGEALVHLLLDPAKRRAFGAAGRARVLAEFNMHRFVGAYERLFEEMVAERQRSLHTGRRANG